MRAEAITGHHRPFRGSHQRFVNGLREARLSRECLELLLLLAQHARLMRKAIT